MPLSRTVQLQFAPKISSLEDLLARKNNFFADALGGIKEFVYPRTGLTHKILLKEGSYQLMKLGANRQLSRVKKDFTEEKLEHWPAVLIAINNDPKVQKAVVQVNPKVFSLSSTVAGILQDNINQHLRHYHLHAVFEPIFEKIQFWEIVKKYSGRITQTEFELVSPNMANISGALKIDLKALNKSTNTQKTNLQLNSDKESNLTLDQDDPIVSSLVDYSAQGGGNIKLKVRGLRKKIRTANTNREINIDQATIEGSDPKQVLDVLKDLLQ